MPGRVNESRRSDMTRKKNQRRLTARQVGEPTRNLFIYLFYIELYRAIPSSVHSKCVMVIRYCLHKTPPPMFSRHNAGNCYDNLCDGLLIFLPKLKRLDSAMRTFCTVFGRPNETTKFKTIYRGVMTLNVFFSVMAGKIGRSDHEKHYCWIDCGKILKLNDLRN